MKGIRLGDYNQLKVVKKVDFGLYLDGGDEGEILLPSRYVPEGSKVGDELTVFIYLDQEERPVATTEHPLAKMGDFAYLRVAWVNEYGAFLDWGLMKDIFCPFKEQKMRMVKDNYYIVYIKLDEESYRIMATAKVERYFAPQPPSYLPGDDVDLIVWQKTDLGFKVIIDNCYPGLVYENQVFRPLHAGDRLRGYISCVRPDGKIDVMLQPTGRQQTEEFANTLLNYLHDNGGHCNLGDKSPAELIADTFKVSKKTFKKAVGDLYRRKLITIADDGITLV
ncbi:CvfB family protein [Marseilla massiliensis]|uniref:CvfB family protein n=1 Tax=Marseilla massiliensis TaxID=1841864 RepID=UPI00201147DF|nr:S1-like domain-containing RNA-binding protein [Marseilla massiliensis]MCL1611250.1 S1-like domain-containing RNA-binding protein [Marseilla massiliensis]